VKPKIKYFVIYEVHWQRGEPTPLRAIGFLTKKSALRWLVDFKHGIGNYYFMKAGELTVVVK